MIIRKIRGFTEWSQGFNTAPPGDYNTEAAITDGGELVFIMRKEGTPTHTVHSIRFNRYDTQKIRSALNKGG